MRGDRLDFNKNNEESAESASGSSGTIHKPIPVQKVFKMPHLPTLVHSRKTIKMEGWMNVTFQANDLSQSPTHSVSSFDPKNLRGINALSPTRKWCALENGFIWLFDSASDNFKSLNAPVVQVSVFECVVDLLRVGKSKDGNDIDARYEFSVAVERGVWMFAVDRETVVYHWISEICAARTKKYSTVW
jgi:hypothetical protein